MLSILLIIILLSLVVLKLSHRGIDINSLNIGNYHNKLKQRLETFLENKVYEYPSLEHFQSLVSFDTVHFKHAPCCMAHASHLWQSANKIN